LRIVLAMTAAPVTPGDFTQQARFYATARPDYPDALIDALLAQIGTPPPARVADVGAGTGISSRLLARHGLEVVAIEPNAAMRAAAAPAAGVTWQDGSFEATGLPGASVDWAVAAQAFHWADPARALPEMRRILRPGRWFTVFWNDRDVAASPVLAETMRIIGAEVPGFDEAYRLRDWAAELVATGDFHTVLPLELRHVVPMTGARFLDLWRSHNRLHATTGEERVERVLAEIGRMLERRNIAALDVPYVCRAWSARCATPQE
jgi:SAM-dependent methyltransferase